MKKNQNITNKIKWLLQEKYNGKLTNKAKKDIERLKNEEPIDYLISFIDFLDCKINLSKKPLIPRVETEFWIDKLINEDLKLKKHNLKILDMFSGSGAIGIAILKSISFSKVIFADSEENCLEQIKINCRINIIPKNRYKVIKSNVFKNVKGKFDYIVANPPYISPKRISKIQKSVLKYEPHVALFGGNDGLFYIEKLLAEVPKFLNYNGKVYVEFDSIQKKQIEIILKKLKYQRVKFFKDQYNKWRYFSVE